MLDKHCDYSDFDFAWEPAPWESHYRHAFASQWQKDSGTYLVPKFGYTETKYSQEQTVQRLDSNKHWDKLDFNFDYSWHPDELEPDYEYHFPTQWQRQGGPVYRGSAGIKFMSSQKVKANSTQIFYMDFMNQQSKKNYLISTLIFS